MLIALLREAAAADPDHVAVETGQDSLSYAALVARAETAAAGLDAQGIARFGIAAADPLTVVVLLAAASLAGSEACVYPRNLDLEGVAGFADRLGHEAVFGDEPLELGAVRSLTLAQLAGGGAVPAPPDVSHVLILTTGTTGEPKGAKHDWARLIAAVRRSDADLHGRWLLAYNLNQFASFQVLLHAFVHRSAVVVPPSSQARDVAATLAASDITHVSATPTFWRLLVGASDSDVLRGLSLKQITLGGEASPGSLIETLKDVFPGANISHVYAGTEFGSVVSVSDGLPGLPLSVLERGEDAGAQFRVVDGELQVRSRSAMLGYHGGDSPDDWLPTGDLVEERDGRLHFVGRTTEIINVGGAKVHPLPIEELLATVPGVLLSAVYGSENAITGQIVAVDVVLEPGADPDDVTAAIHEACSALPRPGRPRRIRFVDSLDVRGHKVVRREAEVSG